MSPPHRLVMLGASNVRMGLPAIVDAARSLAGGPIELLAAVGHGRSYGKRSSIPGRSLPSIVECGLWQAIEELQPAPTAAVVTDVGNDLLYGIEPKQLIDWVAICLDLLQQANARVLLTELPLANLDHLSPGRFLFFRTVFFPPCRLSLAEMSQRAREVNEGLKRLATQHGIATLRPSSSWYGYDPIHIQRRLQQQVWKKILSRVLASENQVQQPSLTMRERLSLKFAAPVERRVFGIEQHRSQPSCRLRDASSASFY